MNARSSGVVVEVVGDRHVRVVGERQVDAPAGRGGTEAASCSQPQMPSASITNTTGETGRKVPVPRRWMRNGVVGRGASARCCSTTGQVVPVDLERRHQRDVGGDAGGGVSSPSAER